MKARLTRITILGAVALSCATLTLASSPQPATALNPVKPLCSVGGWFSGALGKACGILSKSSRIVGAGKKLLTGHPGQAAKALVSGGVSKVGAAAGLAAIGAWVLVGAKKAVTGTATLIDRTTSPQLRTTWFSSTYWRMAGIAAVLTLPFLFAAAVQSVMRSDLALLIRSAFGYLPLALLAVSIAAPMTMLLLSASDQMSSIVSSAAGGDAARALKEIGGGIGLASTYDGSAFLAFLLGLLLAGGAFTLWLELLVRAAAVYVVVLMLPLAFAALVWPARRVWAVRAVEILVALILAKFAIVAVLTLAAAGLGHKWLSGPTAMLSGLALVTLAAFAPWALVRLLPMAEMASGAAGSLRHEAMGVGSAGGSADGRAEAAAEFLRGNQGDETSQGNQQAREAARAQRDRLDDRADRSAAMAVEDGGPGGGERDDPEPAPSEEPGPGRVPAPSEEPGPGRAPEPSEEPGPGRAPAPSEETVRAPALSEEPGPTRPPDTAQRPGSAVQPETELNPETRPTPEPPEAPAPPPQDPPPVRERIPGMPAPFQQDDMSWPATVLGPEGLRPFPPGDEPAPAVEQPTPAPDDGAL